MGTLRTLFAVSVVFAHSYGFVLVGGQNAVQLFYIISGFLISYVLTEAKSYSCKRDFYINRYLRLYPVYVIVALATLGSYMISGTFGEDVPFFETYSQVPLIGQILLTISNATLFFQDWVMFTSVENGTLLFSIDFRLSEVLLYKGLLVPQAWTLGVELSFYLLAPFIVTSRTRIILVLALSLLLRVCLLLMGLGGNDPWTYRFFPTELALFLAGAFSHQVLLPLYRERMSAARMEKLTFSITLGMISLTLVYWILPGAELLKTLGLLAIFIVLIPFTFLFQKHYKWDRRIGELSYPIYICHMLVIYIIEKSFLVTGIHSSLYLGILSTAFSIALSVVLNKYVSLPFEKYRKLFRVRASLSVV